MSSADKKEDLFPTIGNVVDQADLVSVGEKDQGVEEDEKVVTEIESLCMKCHEEVSPFLYCVSNSMLIEVLVGYYEVTFNFDPVFQRSCCHVLQV